MQLFQFHFGTIERAHASREQRFIYKFQFHFGTIERFVYFSGIGTNIIDFNSTLVRLRERNSKSKLTRQSYFNSTLVRLRARPPLLSVSPIKGFQFHFGTIESDSVATGQLINSIFQFHFGTIESCQQRLRLQSQLISIPLWYD